jgi:hypothetical protein
MRVLTDVAKKRAASKELAAEEKVSLIGPNGQPAKPRKTRVRQKPPPWTFTRMLKYFSMSFAMAVFTFFMLRKEQGVLNWEQYHHLLEPDTKEAGRCYVSVHPETSEEGMLCSSLFIEINVVVLVIIYIHYSSNLSFPT